MHILSFAYDHIWHFIKLICNTIHFMNLNSIHNILDNKWPHYLQQKHLSKINVISKNVTATPHILRKQAKILFTFKWKNKMWSGQDHLKLMDFRLICGFLLAQQPNYIKVVGNRNIGRHFCKEIVLSLKQFIQEKHKPIFPHSYWSQFDKKQT